MRRTMLRTENNSYRQILIDYMSIQKPQIVLFGSNNDEGDADSLTVEGEVVCSSNESKNFGFIMDDNLRLTSHVKKIIQKGYFGLRNVYRSKLFLT